MNQVHPPIDKFCKKCDQSSPHNWDTSNKRYRCKTCHNATNRKYRQTDKAKSKELLYKAVRKIKRNNKEKLVALHGGECSICHLKDPCLAIYDFHHEDPNEKDVNISRIHNWKKAIAEAAKCILVCSNCHRRIHDQLRQQKSPSSFW